jgi:hypothetical protein
MIGMNAVAEFGRLRRGEIDNVPGMRAEGGEAAVEVKRSFA